LLKFAVTALVIVILVGKLGWRDIISTVMQADMRWLMAAMGIFLISGILGVVQWKILLKNRGIPLSFFRAFRLYFIGMFFNNFIFGGIVGDAVKVASIRSQNGKGMAGLAATFLDRFAGLWAMCGFAIFGSIILLKQGFIADRRIGLAMGAVFVTFVAFAGILMFLVAKPLQNLFFSLVDRLPVKGKERIKGIVSEMLIEAHDRHLLVSISLLSIGIQFLRITVHIVTAGALGLLTGGSYHYFLIFVPIIAMLMTIPLPFGVREAAGGALFALAGFPADAAFVLNFLTSLIGISASILGGVFFVTGKVNLFRKAA